MTNGYQRVIDMKTHIIRTRITAFESGFYIPAKLGVWRVVSKLVIRFLCAMYMKIP